MQSAVLSSGAFLGIVLLLTLFSKADSNPLLNREELLNEVDDDAALQLRNPYLIEALVNLQQGLLGEAGAWEKPKRRLDLGLSRGFSGSEAAKHRMGLAAANFAGGPGRKRRSLSYLS